MMSLINITNKQAQSAKVACMTLGGGEADSVTLVM